MPEIRPFRALRYDPEVVGDLGRVVAPPYDVIGPEQRRILLARHPRNAVRLDLPVVEPGDEPDDRYRRAARTFAAWRSDGTFHKDPHPSIYVCEQTYRLPGSPERVQRGFFARLRLEPTGPGAGILAHERTLDAPKEDRYLLLRATGANTSPVVVLYEEPTGRAAADLERLSRAEPEADIRDDDGVRHRLWVVAEDGPGGPVVDELIALAAQGPLVIADGHHRYETALRYRDERRRTRSCETDPAYDFILALLLGTDQPLAVLPTHRILRDLGSDVLVRLVADLPALFETEPADRATLVADAAGFAPGGRGRFGLWTRDGGWRLAARRAAFEPLIASRAEATRGLDVSILQVAIERLAGVDPSQAAAGGRIAYTKSAEEAVEAVDEGRDGADAAFLLEPTPIASILAVAAAGEAMPQKSTYFHPKALTGLLVNAHEW